MWITVLDYQSLISEIYTTYQSKVMKNQSYTTTQPKEKPSDSHEPDGFLFPRIKKNECLRKNALYTNHEQNDNKENMYNQIFSWRSCASAACIDCARFCSDNSFSS